MSVIEKILANVNAMPPESQECVLAFSEHLKTGVKTNDADLLQWLASTSNFGAKLWPKEDWSEDRKAWKAQQVKSNETR